VKSVSYYAFCKEEEAVCSYREEAVGLDGVAKRRGVVRLAIISLTFADLSLLIAFNS